MLEALPKRNFTASGKAKKLILRQGILQQRTLEDAGECVIVLRHDAELRQGHEIEHRYVLSQFQAVGARDRNSFVPQGADHRVKEIAALAHQNENIAGLDGALLRSEIALANP